jgi:hypothetical protein
MQCTGSFSGGLRTCAGDWSSSGRSETASLAVALCYGERRSGTAARRCSAQLICHRGGEETVWQLERVFTRLRGQLDRPASRQWQPRARRPGACRVGTVRAARGGDLAGVSHGPTRC